MTRASLAERQQIAARLRELANQYGEQAVYMPGYDADFIREVAERISPRWQQVDVVRVVGPELSDSETSR